jgi:hypothetical protein
MNTILIYLLSPAAGVVESLQVRFFARRRPHAYVLLDSSAQSLVYWGGNPENNLLLSSFKHVFCNAPYTCAGNQTFNSQCGDTFHGIVPLCGSRA